jgi:hypothetical protein
MPRGLDGPPGPPESASLTGTSHAGMRETLRWYAFSMKVGSDVGLTMSYAGPSGSVK